MRVISGKYKGRKLNSFEGDAIRPTSDRAKEAIFSVLQFEIQNKKFYDAFCGSGAMGIEALSRGAKEVVFTDCAIQSCNLTKKNLKLLEENQRVINSDCLAFLKSTSEKFDIVFLDPPYKSKDGIKALEIIAKRDLLTENGVAIIESGNAVNEHIEGLFIEKIKKYGIANFSFYRKLNDKLAVFAGSFDPVTKGHIHIVEKALKDYDKIIVALGVNENKKYLFDKFTKLKMLELAFASFDRVSVESFDGLLVDFLKSKNTANNIRGIRNDEDLKYEEGMYAKNKELYPEIKNHYIYADDNMKSVSSTSVKQLKNDGLDEWKDLLPEEVLEFLLSRS
jgi:16S rRNA (guanine(966)-N(2))-methyltransferase RsmD/pantetheine-phosphate adenylyltransferase